MAWWKRQLVTEELKDEAAKKVAAGYQRGKNVAELQQALNSYHRGEDDQGFGLLKALFRHRG